VTPDLPLEEVEDDLDDEAAAKVRPYTFMSYNAMSVALLEDGLGEYFPAYLSHRSGCDKCVIDLMRPLFDKGVSQRVALLLAPDLPHTGVSCLLPLQLRPESYSNVLVELHSKKHTKDQIKYEYSVLRENRKIGGRPNPGMYSTFGDKLGYGGVVPTGQSRDLCDCCAHRAIAAVCLFSLYCIQVSPHRHCFVFAGK